MNFVEGAGTGAVSLDEAQYERLATVIQRHTGIRFAADKRSMLEARLVRILAGLGLGSVEQLFKAHLLGDQISPALLSQLVDHVTTSHTHFHREAAHFQHMAAVALPAALRRRRHEQDIRVWCAAAATGQEPYELAMVLREVMGETYAHWQGGVLATDISARALELARAGRYRPEDAERLPPERRTRFLEVAADGLWRIRPMLQGEVTFRRLNLLDETYPFRRDFDVVFCRNVLMYFDEPTRRSILARISSVLAPGGYLYVGQTETLSGLVPGLRPVGPGIHRNGPELI